MLDSWSLKQKYFKKKIYLNLIEKKNIKYASSIHCTTESEVESSKIKTLNSNVEVIPLCLESSCFGGKSIQRKKQILFLGRLHYKKQPDVLLKAFAQLANKTDYELVLAGDGDQEYISNLKECIFNLDLENKVKFVGEVFGEEKSRLFLESSIFVLPSLQENFGVAVAEAMAYGCIPIISKEVALHKVVEKYKAGIVTGTDVESLKIGLECFFDLSSTEITDMSKRCRGYAEGTFHPDKVANQFLSLYKSITYAS